MWCSFCRQTADADQPGLACSSRVGPLARALCPLGARCPRGSWAPLLCAEQAGPQAACSGLSGVFTGLLSLQGQAGASRPVGQWLCPAPLSATTLWGRSPEGHVRLRSHSPLQKKEKGKEGSGGMGVVERRLRASKLLVDGGRHTHWIPGLTHTMT